MKNFLSMFTSTLLVLSLGACAAGQETPLPPESEAPSPLSGEISGEIKVSCYDTLAYKNFLEEAAAAFKVKYPDVSVVIETASVLPEMKLSESEDGSSSVYIASAEDDMGDRNDYINRISAELMSGGGADVLAMDVLPVNKYIENDQLENLKNYMNSDPEFNLADYPLNIFDAMTFDGKMYIIPLDYSFDYFAFDSSLFNESEAEAFQAGGPMTFEELVEIGKDAFARANETSEEPVRLLSLDEQSLFSQIFYADYESFIDMAAKKVSLNDGRFAALLEQIKGYSDIGYINRGEYDTEEITADSFYENLDRSVLTKSKASFSLLQDITKSGGIGVNTGNILGNQDNDKISGILANENGEAAFSYGKGFGVSKNSANKRTAWEFVKFLLSEDMQTSVNIYNTPINRAAFLEQAKLMITNALFYSDRSEGRELTEDEQKALDDYVKAMDSYTKLLNKYFNRDNYIDSTIRAEVASFFDGSKTADEAASVLQSKISLYLSE